MSKSTRQKFWLTAGVEAEFEWPEVDKAIDYSGDTFVLRPPTADAAADIQLGYYKDEEGTPPFVRVSRFLSVLSWWWREPARIGLCAATTARAMRIGNRDISPPRLTPHFDLRAQLPVLTDDDSKLALALYREAIGVRNVSYEFLDYFRILNIGRPNSDKQISWINTTLPDLTDHRALERLSALQKGGMDKVGEYLYGSGRCAVAHAAGEPIIDPDGGDNYVRLQRDLPIARALAEFRIENEYNVPNWYSTRRAEEEKVKKLTSLRVRPI